MSLLDKATIITTPTAHSEGKLHSIKGGAVADFDVVRGSAATRVNAEGLIEDISTLSGEIVTNGDFSNGSTDWDLRGVTTVYDDKANTVSTSSEYILLQSSVTTIGKQYKITYDLVVDSGTFVTYYDTVNLSSRYRTTSGTYTEYFEAVALNMAFRSVGNFTGSIDNISVVEVIDATNIPRIDYTDGTASILLEPQSTNLIPYSEDFSNAYWTKSGASVVGGFASPSGDTSAFKLIEDTSSGAHLVFKNNVITGAGKSTISIKAKADGRNWILIYDTEQLEGCYFDLSNGTVGTLIGSPDAYSITALSNDWYDISLTTTSTTRVDFQVYTAITDNDFNYIGDGTSGLYIWGAQLEFLSYATSYIPTSGVIATRLADSVTGAGDATTFNSTEGVLYAEMAALANDGTSRRITLFKDLSNKVSLVLSPTSNSIQGLIVSGGSIQFNQTFSISNTLDFNKIAFKYKTNDFAIWVNGVEVATDTSGNTPIGLSQLSFADGDNTLNVFTGKVKSVITFNTALTDAELECLTTI